MEFEWSNKTRERDHLPYERLDNGRDEYGHGHYLANDLKSSGMLSVSSGCWPLADDGSNDERAWVPRAIHRRV